MESKYKLNLKVSKEDSELIKDAAETTFVEKQSGAVIKKTSYEEAELKTKLYTFDKGYFSASQFNGEAHPTGYFIKNGYDKPETFGLAQTVKVGEQVDESEDKKIKK